MAMSRKNVWELFGMNVILGAGIAVGVFLLMVGTDQVKLLGFTLATTATGMDVVITHYWPFSLSAKEGT